MIGITHNQQEKMEELRTYLKLTKKDLHGLGKGNIVKFYHQLTRKSFTQNGHVLNSEYRSCLMNCLSQSGVF